jgi:hypothetical protein
VTLSAVAGKGLRALLGLGLLVVGWAGFFTLAALATTYPVVAPTPGARPWLRGAFHVHTTRSDGRGSLEEVAAAAKAAGLRFVVLTDHNDFAPREPAFVEGVLMIPALEISTAQGHLVALGLERPLEGVKPQGEAALAEAAVRAAGGWSVLAHPVQTRNPWRHEEVARRAEGYELYSADTFFREAMRRPVSRLVPALGALWGRPLHGVMMLVEPEPGPIERLLELEREKPRVALCAHDAHGLPPYGDVFQAMAMYLPPGRGSSDVGLPGDARAAAREVLERLSRGEALCAFRALGEPEGFALEGLEAGAREAHVGEVLTVRLPPHEGAEVRVQVWGAGRLRPDGVTVELVEAGAVQVEAWMRAPGDLLGTRWRPWIVPSPLRVLPQRGAR